MLGAAGTGALRFTLCCKARRHTEGLHRPRAPPASGHSPASWPTRGLFCRRTPRRHRPLCAQRASRWLRESVRAGAAGWGACALDVSAVGEGARLPNGALHETEPAGRGAGPPGGAPAGRAGLATLAPKRRH